MPPLKKFSDLSKGCAKLVTLNENEEEQKVYYYQQQDKEEKKEDMSESNQSVS